MSTRINKLLNVSIIGTIIFLFSSQWCIAQMSNSATNKKLRYIGALSVARSTFEVSGFPSPNYPSLELRLGAGIVKPLGRLFELKSGLYLGLKIKRESYFFGPAKQITKVPGAIFSLDKTASNRNHIVLDVPLVVQFNLPFPKLGLRAGVNARFWKPNNDDVDVLTAKEEIGILGGISHKLTNKINIGLDFYYGLTKIWGGSYSINNTQSGDFDVRNQFAQLTVEYSF